MCPENRLGLSVILGEAGKIAQLQRHIGLEQIVGDVQEVTMLSLLRIGFDGVLVTRKHVLHQAILIARAVAAVGTAEFRLNATLEVPMTLQVVLVLVRLATGDAHVGPTATTVVIGFDVWHSVVIRLDVCNSVVVGLDVCNRNV